MTLRNELSGSSGVAKQYVYCSVSMLQPLKKTTETREIFLQIFVSSADGPAKQYGNKLGMKNARTLPYYRTMVEKKDKNRTLPYICCTTHYIVLIICNRCRVVFLSFFSAIVCSRVVFLHVFIPFLFPYFFQVHSYMK